MNGVRESARDDEWRIWCVVWWRVRGGVRMGLWCVGALVREYGYEGDVVMIEDVGDEE